MTDDCVQWAEIQDFHQPRKVIPEQIDPKLTAILDELAAEFRNKVAEAGVLPSGDVWGICMMAAAERGLLVLAYPSTESTRPLLIEIGNVAADAVVVRLATPKGNA